MINRNDLSPEKRYVNGDLGTLETLGDSLIIRLDRKDKNGSHIYATVPKYDIPLFRGKGMYIGYYQYPVQVAAALTIHKSQGATILSPLHIVVDGSAFKRNKGMLYTAISRVKTLSQLSFSNSVLNSYFKHDKAWKALLRKLSTDDLDLSNAAGNLDAPTN
jgi:ATP-dependent exoDNAse (exonuclease V) alpha subunit